MRRLLPLVLLTLAHPQQPDPTAATIAAGLAAQRAAATAGNRVLQLHHQALTLLTTELTRPHPPCNTLNSPAKTAHCLAADFQTTNHNYLAFANVLHSSFASPDPTVPTPPEKAFAAAEAAWRTYRDRTCEAFQDNSPDTTAPNADLTQCESTLTRTHMKELADLHIG
jgi:uncharacterized protein YecT (DUF1311 family)